MERRSGDSTSFEPTAVQRQCGMRSVRYVQVLIRTVHSNIPRPFFYCLVLQISFRLRLLLCLEVMRPRATFGSCKKEICSFSLDQGHDMCRHRHI